MHNLERLLHPFPCLLFLCLLVFVGCSTTTNIQQQADTRPPSQIEVFYDEDTPDDSGMWLLPQIDGAVHAEMAAKGLQLPASAFYSPDSPSLNQAIVRINIGESGGGTGSFVSDQGLILTNHHVAYDAIGALSTADQNYLKEGYYADSMSDEIPIENYNLYITIEQKEVTGQINSQLPDTLTYFERQQQSQKIRQQLIAQRQGNNEDLVVEIDDYWAGNRQFMSVYKVIRDVRLVHAPPESIGKYGGDLDNWQWPRHTGDYTFLRAYVAPDGSGRTYHESNVPFQPARHIRINAQGISPGDFTMVFGFPGQTYRYESSYAFEFYHGMRNPVLIDSYQAVLDALEYAADQDPQTAVENASQRASIANSLKYYHGIQNGFDKYNIIQQKRNIEDEFAQWIKQDSLRQVKYRRVLPQLEQAYKIASQTGDLLYGTVNVLNNSQLLQIAGLYNSYYQYLADSTQSELDQANKDSLIIRHKSILENINIEAQNMMLSDMLYMMTTLPEGKVMFHLIQLFGDVKGDTLKKEINNYINEQQKQSIVYSPDRAKKFLALPIDSARNQPVDEMVQLYQALFESYQFSRKNYLQHTSYLNPGQELYVEGMMEFRNDSTEYPDANFTLRLSGGRVQGYSPQDGIYYTPFTTFKGMLAKDTDTEPFDAPQVLEQYFDSTQTGAYEPNRFATSGGKQIVNFLSTNDITGGNSGSPVLNGTGEMVGLAFDGNIEGVVGDYFYDPELNRTISVDVRYILFLLEEFTGADRLLKEIELVASPGAVPASAVSGN
jgi:hypothetical protein